MASSPATSSIIEKDIDLVYAEKIRRLLVTDPTHARCKDILLRSLFTFGLNGRSAIEGTTTTEQFSNFVDADLNRLAIPATIDKNVQGFTLYNFPQRTIQTPDGPRKLVYPNYVRAKNLSITKVLNSDYTTSIKIRRTNRTSPQDADYTEPDIFYYEWPGYAPDWDGVFHSQLASLVDVNEAFLLKEKCLEAAIMQSSHPPVLYQEAAHKQDISESSMQIGYAETHLGEMATELEKQKSYEQVVRAQNNKYVNHVWIPDRSLLNQTTPLSERSGVTFYPTPVDNLHIVEKGYVVAPQITPAVPQQNFLEFEASKDRKIALAWGIPPSIALADSQKTSASGNSIGDNDLEYFAKKMKFEEKQITDFITAVYKTFLSIPENSKADVIFDLPTIPWISARALYEMYNQNIINHETLQRQTLRLNGMSDNDRTLVPNIIVRPAPGCSENTVTAMIEARANNINADSFEKRQKALLVKDERINGPADSSEEDPELKAIDLEMKEKEVEIAKLKLKAMDKQIKLQEKKNQAPAPAPAAKA